MMPGESMSRTESKGERKRTTTTKQNTSNSAYLAHKFSPWALNRLLFLRMRYLKCMRNFKRWFNRFFLCPGVKIDFFILKCRELKNNYLYSFGHKEKIDFFVCFALKCERTTAFLIVRPIFFRCDSTVTRKFSPYVINT